MTISGPRDLEHGDELWVKKSCPDALRGLTLRVSDVEIEDIGITETFAVSLVTDAEAAPNYSVVGTTADSQVTLEAIGKDENHRLFWKQFERA